MNRKRNILSEEKQNLIQVAIHSRELFNKIRWVDGVVTCPYCGGKHIYKFKNGSFKCAECHKRFTETSNTIFHSTKIPKSHWMVAYYLMSMGKNVASEELSRYLGITQRSCWYMLHKIRIALDTANIALEGNIAVDEVFLGGKWSSIIIPKKIDIMKRYDLWYEGQVKRTWSKRNVKRAIAAYKQPVYGMNDGNHIVLRAMPNGFDSKDLLQLTLEHTSHIERLISDQSTLYSDIAKTGIEVVQMNHSKREFSNNGFSSNRIEGTFSHLKRRIRCQHVRPNKKYIQLYLNEFCFRWNNRDVPAMERMVKMMRYSCAVGKITRKDVDQYDWTSAFHERQLSRRECFEDWMDYELDPLISSIEIDGVKYEKDEFEDLKKLLK